MDQCAVDSKEGGTETVNEAHLRIKLGPNTQSPQVVQNTDLMHLAFRNGCSGALNAELWGPNGWASTTYHLRRSCAAIPLGELNCHVSPQEFCMHDSVSDSIMY